MNNKLVKNRSAEKDIRNWLTESGYSGPAVRFEELELHAIKKPGWVQVFRFQAEAKNEHGIWQKFYGVLRDDDRFNRLEIEVFDDLSLRNQLLSEWSQGLITASRAHANPSETAPISLGQKLAAGFFVLVVFALILSKLF